jgi:RNA polymerase sigma-70 factor (ECF subfamily)
VAYVSGSAGGSDGDRFSGLVERVAQQRDRAAFIELFDHFAPRLNAHLRRMGADAAVAEEIAQDVMIVLWRKAELFDRTKSSVATWLYRIARNRRIDLLRRDRSALLDAEDPALLPAAAPAPDGGIDARTREEKVRAAMAQLPPDQLALVRLAFFDGLSHSEIATREGLPLGTVKSRIRLAFGRLRKQLESDAAIDVE